VRISSRRPPVHIGGMAKSNIGGMVLGALALGSRLSMFEFVVLVSVLVVWMAPNWLHKLVVLADELIELIEKLRRFRDRRSRGHTRGAGS
jgi:hypothetical protein